MNATVIYDNKPKAIELNRILQDKTIDVFLFLRVRDTGREALKV